jgi:uncharacterized protein (TIRG00374 family)
MKVKYKFFKLITSLFIIVLIGLSADWQTLFNTKLNIANIDIILFFFLFWSSVFFRTFRWHMLFNDKNNMIKFKDSLRLYFVGQSLNIILPSGTGDIAKSYYGSKWTGKKERMITVSLLDKLIAISSIVFITPVAFYYSNNYLILIAGFLSILPVIFLLRIEFFKKYRLINVPLNFISNRVKKINLESFIINLKLSRRKIFISFVFSIIAYVITYMMLFLCFKSVGLSIPFVNILYSIPFLTLGRLFPFTLNGIGSDEALIIFLFSYNDLSHEPILLGALLFRLILMVFPALIGLIWITKN